jgi:hypothetical protein
MTTSTICGTCGCDTTATDGRVACSACKPSFARVTLTLPTGTVEHAELAMYAWCGGGTLTTARFTVCGLEFVARRFWRRDMGCAGIELYTVCRGGLGSEDPIEGYYCDAKTDPASRRAKYLIAAGLAGTSDRPLDLDLAA